jgi:hypothetical protein
MKPEERILTVLCRDECNAKMTIEEDGTFEYSGCFCLPNEKQLVLEACFKERLAEILPEKAHEFMPEDNEAFESGCAVGFNECLEEIRRRAGL